MIKQIRILWKYFLITTEYVFKEIKEDILKFFRKEYYTTKTRNIPKNIKSLKKLFISPKYLRYWTMLIVVMSLIKGNRWWIFFSLLLFIAVSYWKEWISGNPKKFYREKYFSSEFDKKQKV